MPVGIFRLAGIYGPGRNPFVKLADGTAHRIVKPGQVFNRIHVADIAATLRAAIARPAARLYNVADDEPAPPQDVVAYAAGLMGITPPPEVPFAEADLSPMARRQVDADQDPGRGSILSDGGKIEVEGRPLDESSRKRIAFVHQDLGLIESMSVGENMAMGYGYPRRWKFIDWAAVDRAAEAAVARLGSPLPLDRPVSELSRAEKSIVAIARALVNDPELLVLDEPTASLPEADVSRLFSILFRLRDRGVGIIHVTHRLDEVFRIADALTVLRDGRTVAVYRPVSISPEQLVTDIVGRGARVAKLQAAEDRRPRVACRRRPADRDRGSGVVRVAAGEIVGLAGLRGAGHETVGRVLGGVLSRSAGTIRSTERRPVAGRPARRSRRDSASPAASGRRRVWRARSASRRTFSSIR